MHAIPMLNTPMPLENIKRIPEVSDGDYLATYQTDGAGMRRDAFS